MSTRCLGSHLLSHISLNKPCNGAVSQTFFLRLSILKDDPPFPTASSTYPQFLHAEYTLPRTHHTFKRAKSPLIITSAASSSSAAGGAASSSSSSAAAPQGFTNLERLISDTLGGGPSGDWREVEGCWVLDPPDNTPPRCLVHFTGGAFVGAAPQLAYRPLLEALAARGALIVATPFATGFDHLRTADEIYFKLSRCLKALGPSVLMLPAYGLGHSLGSLMQVLICSRYIVPRAGNVLMSFNNKPATDSIPFLSPFIAPSARALGPILAQLATSPLRSNVEQWIDVLKGISPGVVKQVIPVLEQLTPIYLDVAQGTQEFIPPPEEVRSLVKSGYAVGRNLLLKFVDDSIDETPTLASIMQSSAAGASLELTLKSLPGDHVRPLQQDLSKISPDLAKFTTQQLNNSENFWNSIGNLADQAGLPAQAKEQLSGLTKAATGVAAMLGEAVGKEGAAKNIEELADDVGGWMGLAGGGGGGRRRNGEMAALPPPSTPSATANDD